MVMAAFPPSMSGTKRSPPRRAGCCARNRSPISSVLTNAAKGLRVLYTSTDGIDGKTGIAVSGAIYVPNGTPPAGGWPVIAWAHGTTGTADVCAPSWMPRAKRDTDYLNAWLAQGYAVVAPPPVVPDRSSRRTTIQARIMAARSTRRSSIRCRSSRKLLCARARDRQLRDPEATARRQLTIRPGFGRRLSALSPGASWASTRACLPRRRRGLRAWPRSPGSSARGSRRSGRAAPRAPCGRPAPA